MIRKKYIPFISDGNQMQEGAGDEAPESPDVHFEPLVKLEEVAVTTNEEDESVEFKMYAPLCDDRLTSIFQSREIISFFEGFE